MWVRLPYITAELTQKATIRLLTPRGGAVQTVTLDNGSEFAGHDAFVEAMNVSIYFYDHYCFGQYGNNENTNGIIRQYYPKGIDHPQGPMPNIEGLLKNWMTASENDSVIEHMAHVVQVGY